MTIRKLDRIGNYRIRCYDNGGTTIDRYTAVFMDEFRLNGHGIASRFYASLGMSASPFHPQGVCQHSEAVIGRHLGKRIAYASLPRDCRKAIEQECI